MLSEFEKLRHRLLVPGLPVTVPVRSFVIADLHFGHANAVPLFERWRWSTAIADACKGAYSLTRANAEDGRDKVVWQSPAHKQAVLRQHDDHLIQAWNSVVTSDDDIVFVVGDFSLKKASHYVNRLRGKIVLCRGNHDLAVKLGGLSTEKCVVIDHVVIDTMSVLGWQRYLILHHYPTLDGLLGSSMLACGLIHGHMHGCVPAHTVRDKPGYLNLPCSDQVPSGQTKLLPNVDVGVDNSGGYPVPLFDVVEAMLKRIPKPGQGA